MAPAIDPETAETTNVEDGPLTAEFAFERETKNKVRYAEVVTDGDEEVVGTLYVSKSAFSERPERLKVTIESA